MGNKASAKGKSTSKSSPHVISSGKSNISKGGTLRTPLHASDFHFRAMGHHGLPQSCQTMAYSNAQRVLAVGTSTGVIKLFGKSGVEVVLQDITSRSSIVHMHFNRSGSRLLCFSANTLFQVFDTHNFKKLGGLSPGWTRGASITCVHVPPDTHHPYVYAGLDTGGVCVIDFHVCENTGYSISPQALGIDMDSDQEDDTMAFIESNPADLNSILIGFERAGLILWDLAKRRVTKRYILPSDLSDLAFGGDPSLTCAAWHQSGHQFVTGFSSGHIAVFDSAHKSSGKTQSLCMIPLENPKPVSHLLWASSPLGTQGPGAIVIGGGNDTHGVTVLWQKNGHAQKGGWNVAPIDPVDGPVCSMVLPTWDSSPVMALLLTYPPGVGPYENLEDSHPSGYIMIGGDPQDGIHPRLYVQPLPSGSTSSSGRTKSASDPWPPMACDPPEPTPQALHFPSPLRRTAVKVIVDCGVCPNDVIDAIRTSSPPRPHPEGWSWPISGGSRNYDKSSGARQLMATGHIDGTVCIWACGPPGSNTLSDHMKGLSSSLEPIYEFEPRLLCEGSGYSPPSRPAITAMSLSLQSRILCIGCESGDVLVCSVRPRGRASVSTGTEYTGAAVYLLHCMQGVHPSRITHVALMSQAGKLAVADNDGVVSILDLDSGSHQLVAIPVAARKAGSRIGPIRSMTAANVPCEDVRACEDDQCSPLPVLFTGLSDGAIVLCNMETGDPLSMMLPPKGSVEPLNFVEVINANGVPPIDPVTRRFSYLSKNVDQHPREKVDNDNVTDTAEDANAKETQKSGGDVDSKPGTSEYQVKPPTNNGFIGRRFLLAVAGPEVRVYQIKLPPLQSMLKKGLVPMNVPLRASALLPSAPVSISVASIFGSACPKPQEYPSLVSVDNMSHLAVLSLPFLWQVYEAEITAFEDIEYPRCMSIMASGDMTLVTELSAIHRFSLPKASLLGNDVRPSMYIPQNSVGASAVGNGTGSTGSGHKKTKKKKARGSMFGMFGGGHKPADLSKIFANATLRAQALAKNKLSELGIDEDEDPGGNSSDANTRVTNLTGGIGDTKNVMNQNMNKLSERGEKLDQLKEQTNRMMLSAMRFEEQVSFGLR